MKKTCEYCKKEFEASGKQHKKIYCTPCSNKLSKDVKANLASERKVALAKKALDEFMEETEILGI